MNVSRNGIAARPRAGLGARLALKAGVLLAGSTLPGAVLHAQDAQALVERINAYRDAPHDCGPGAPQAASPLAPSDALSAARPTRGGSLLESLDRAGYQAAAATVLSVTGPGDVAAATDALVREYCESLLDPTYSDIGVTHAGPRWQVVLAQPLRPAGLGDWQAAGQDVLERVNAARAEARDCGAHHFEAAAPLSWSRALGEAALAHSRSMAQHDAFGHVGPDGRGVAERARAAGYAWQRISENIAAGVRTPEAVVAGWLASPRHCRNLMDPRVTEMGAAYAIDADSSARIYWTQVFGTRR